MSYSAYVSKHNSNHEKDVIFFIILNDDGWHYVAVKQLTALLIGIMSKHWGDFYYLNCLHSFRRENKHKLYKKVCENKHFCNIVMSS